MGFGQYPAEFADVIAIATVARLTVIPGKTARPTRTFFRLMRVQMMENTGAADQQPMGAATHPQVSLCAVCKVDLRGRFVLADEEFERLLGYSQDDVFGRHLTEFAAEENHEVINALLTQYSQYESVHQTATISLLTANSEPVRATIVTALNFVAGNAVNFQVLLTPCGGEGPGAAPQQSESDELSIDDYLGLLDGTKPTDWSVAAGPLCRLAQAEECLVYTTSDDALVLVNSSADPAGGGDAVSSVEAAGDLHWWVANAGEPYRFDNTDHVQKALQDVATAPTELLLPFSDDTVSHGLIRFVYAADADSDSPRLAAAMDRVTLLLSARQRKEQSSTKPPAGESGPVSLPTLWPVISDHLYRTLGDAINQAEPLSHEIFDSLAAKQKVQVAKLQASLHRAYDVASAMQQVDHARRREKSQKVDLNLIVNAAFEHLQPELAPESKLTTGDLPSVTSRPTTLQQLLIGLIRLLTGVSPAVLLALNVTAKQQTETVELDIEASWTEGATSFDGQRLSRQVSGTELAAGYHFIDQLLVHRALDSIEAAVRVDEASDGRFTIELKRA